MKAFIINPYTQTIRTAKIDNLEDMQTAVGGYIERVGGINGDDLYVDEEGALKQHTAGFMFNNRMLVGNGLILGVDRATGDSVDAKSTLEDIKKLVQFVQIISV